MAEIIIKAAIEKVILIKLRAMRVKKNKIKNWAISVCGRRIKRKSFNENMIFCDFKYKYSWFKDLNEWIQIKYKVKEIIIGNRWNVNKIKKKWKDSVMKSWTVIILNADKNINIIKDIIVEI